jgi:hypothetical protein
MGNLSMHGHSIENSRREFTPPLFLPFCEVREEETPYLKKVSEKLLKCIWLDKEFYQPLKTLDGKSVTILFPGWWNRGAGPDFLNAVFRCANGKIRKGNVEIHVNKCDWDHHSHSGDRNYESLAIHVFLRKGGGKRRLQSKALQIELGPFLRKNIEELKDEFDTDSYPLLSESVIGSCCPVLQKLEPGQVAHLLDSNGEARMREKAARPLKNLGMGGFEQLCYEGIMEALGYKNNSEAFSRLARSIPYGTLISSVEGLKKEEAVLELQAFLLSAAGFLPLPKDGGKGIYCGPASVKFLLAGCRPSNYPQVRLAGVAYLLERFRAGGLFNFFLGLISGMDKEEVCSRKALRKLALHLVVDEPSDFWASHHSWAGRKSPSPRKLIGLDRASVVLWNAILPVLSAYSEKTCDTALSDRIHALYSHFPLLPKNSVQSFMNAYLLGERFQRSPVVNSAMRQQGLIHVYKKFCEANEKGCLDCGFLSMLPSKELSFAN